MSKMAIIVYNFFFSFFFQGENVELTCIQAIDMSALCVHPACFVALTLTSLRIEPSRMNHSQRNNFVINVSGRLLMVNQQDDHAVSLFFNFIFCCSILFIL